uniref:Uncharacterized protein n=1 Tax=Romanomermis culicivorax TaxID=13658 RepID=A0A915J227_ROMCU
MQQQEIKYCKAHKDRMMDEWGRQHTLLPSTSHTKHSMTPSERTTRPREKQVKQKEPQTVGQASSTTGPTAQLKVTPIKTSNTQTKTAQLSMLSQ